MAQAIAKGFADRDRRDNQSTSTPINAPNVSICWCCGAPPRSLKFTGPTTEELRQYLGQESDSETNNDILAGHVPKPGFMRPNMDMAQTKGTYTQMNSGAYQQPTGRSAKTYETKGDYGDNFSDITDGDEAENVENTDGNEKKAVKKGIGDTLPVDPNKVYNTNNNNPQAVQVHVDTLEEKKNDPETGNPSSSTGKIKQNVTEEPKVSDLQETTLNKNIQDGNNVEQQGVKKKNPGEAKKNPQNNSNDLGQPAGEPSFLSDVLQNAKVTQSNTESKDHKESANSCLENEPKKTKGRNAKKKKNEQNFQYSTRSKNS